MKKGGLGGAILLAVAAIAFLALDREPPPARAPHSAPAPAAGETLPPAPPEPPPVTAPEPTREPGRPGARLVGRVTDGEGPVADAGIWLSKGMGPGEGEVVARTDEDGRYVYDGVDGEERLVGAIAAKHRPSDLRRIAPRTEPVFELDFELRRGGGTLALEFGDAESADVLIEPVFLESPESGGRRLVEVRGKSSVLVDGLGPEWSFLRVRAPGFAPQTVLTRAPPEGVVAALIPLGQGAVVVGTARTSAGAPAAGARVDIVGWEWAGTVAVADALGAYRMERAPAALVELRAVGADGAEARNLVRLREGEECLWDPVLQAPAEIAGRVVDEQGTPVGASLTCWPVGSLRPSDEVIAAAGNGSFRIAGLPNREHRIAAWWPGWWGKVPPAAEVTATPGGAPVTITLPRADGFLRGVVTIRNGLPAAGTTVRAWPSGAPGKEVRTQAAADGTFQLGPLPAGTYFLELHADGEPTLHLDGFSVVAGQALDVGVLRFAAGGRVSVRVLDEAGSVVPVPEAPISVTSFDGGIRYNVMQQGDAFVSEELVPGRYLASGGMTGLVVEVDVAAGETTGANLKLRGNGILEAVALRKDGSRVVAEFSVAAGGHVVAFEEGSDILRLRLATGWYTVAATDGTGARDSRQFQIAGDGSRTQVALDLGMGLPRR